MMTPYKPYFLIKIDKQEQHERREKIGRFFIPPGYTKMTRNMQSGEIVSIGVKAKELFPEAKEGHTLLIHHFVEGGSNDEGTDNDYLIDEDEIYKYYLVTSCDWRGRANETYGVWTGEKLIPHPDFIFLEADKPADNEHNPNEFLDNAMQKSKGGMLEFVNYKESRAEKLEKIQVIQMRNKSLAKSTITPEIKEAIEANEREMAAITKDINKAIYVPYTIHAVNPQVSEWFNRDISAGDTIYCKNTGCMTQMEFDGQIFIVANVLYIGFIVA